MDDYLEHRGTPHEGMTPHSGRYPYGSGKNGFQRPDDFLARVNEIEKKVGKDQVKVAEELGIKTTELRQYKKLAKEERNAALYARAVRLKEKGYSGRQAAKLMNIPEASYRYLLKTYETKKQNNTAKAADALEKELKKKHYIDVGAGSNIEMGISETQLATALRLLKDKGYTVETVRVEQAGNPGQYTTVKVLAEPGKTKTDIWKDREKIKPLGDTYSSDKGNTYAVLEKPQSISSKRIYCNYAETGGKEKDGVIEIRRGVEDLDLGDSKYAQVRIAVDGTNYLKGMAMYSDNIPKGYDIVFNTNKSKDVPMIAKNEGDKEVLKRMKDDPDNPFGALIKQNMRDTNGQLLKGSGQSHYIGKDGKEHLSAINKVKEEGDWTKWSKTIASQFLSKQAYGLAKRQLGISYKEKKQELALIESLTNPVIKKELLKSFADDCDSSSIHLKAAALPRQAWKCILPVPELKDNQIYAPTFREGEQVALVRYPHGGTFEIPLLTVTHRNKAAKAVMENANDAVGINSVVAERLSGADFDGDTVLVIPTSQSKIISTPALQGLKDFDPSSAYPGYEGMKVIKSSTKQIEMGKISNLITDMTLQGAKPDELARAVRHSMVVIDSEKHKLNYKQSYKDNNIYALSKRYQNGHGASTLISSAKSPVNIPQRSDYVKIDKATGKKIYQYTGATYVNKKGETVKRTQEIPKMEYIFSTGKDATALSSGTRMEGLYAEYANQLRAMANQARKEEANSPGLIYSPSAAKTYENEVKSLNVKLNNALKNQPRERQAQLRANIIYEKKLKQFPYLKEKEYKDDRKKIKTQALAQARLDTGATPRRERHIDITDREWDAIQAGAIHNHKLEQIIKNTDLDELKERAMPRNKAISSSTQNLIKTLLAAGYTQADIADRVGVSVSTVSKVAIA